MNFKLWGADIGKLNNLLILKQTLSLKHSIDQPSYIDRLHSHLHAATAERRGFVDKEKACTFS